MNDNNTKPRVTVLWGPSGAGKTMSIYERYGRNNVFFARSCNRVDRECCAAGNFRVVLLEEMPCIDVWTLAPVLRGITFGGLPVYLLSNTNPFDWYSGISGWMSHVDEIEQWYADGGHTSMPVPHQRLVLEPHQHYVSVRDEVVVCGGGSGKKKSDTDPSPPCDYSRLDKTEE